MKKFLCAFVLLFCLCASAQTNGTGAYNFAPLESVGFDQINTGNLNVRFNIPLVTRQGRGLPFYYALQYEGLIWNPVTTNSVTTWQNDPDWGFHGQLNGTGFSGYLTHSTLSISCPRPPNTSGPYVSHTTRLNGFTYHDPYGASHTFNYSETDPCPNNLEPTGDDPQPVISGDGSSSDGSGYRFITTNGWQVQTRDGKVITPVFSQQSSFNSSIADANGNQITSSGSTFTDTLGVNALTISGSGTPGNPRTFTYPVTRQSDNTSTKSATVNYVNYVVTTNFQCANIGEVGQDGSFQVNLVDSVQLASGDTYHFTYEATPGYSGRTTGRLASVTLPTGGTINYSYSGGCGSGINPDGTVAVLNRATSPGGTRTYTRTISGTTSQTTKTDEKNNVSVYDFVADTTGTFLFETHRSIYDGAATGTPLVDQYTCSNQSSQSCSSVITLPITSQWITTSPNGKQQVLVQNSYDGNGTLLTGSNIYGQQSSSTTYNGLGEPLTQILQDNSGTTFRQITYGYDETNLTATSGLPQHTTASGTRGNLTSTHVTGSPNINTSTTYFDTGMPMSTTAADGGVTTYTYDSTGAFAQGTALPTPSSGVPLSTSASYDAYSAVLVSATGMNSGQTATVNQYDALLRPVNMQLPSGSIVTSAVITAPLYTRVSQTLDSSRTAWHDTLLDSYGRLSREATHNSNPAFGNDWYQVDYCYDQAGLLQFKSSSYQANGVISSPKQCSGSGTSYQYDALGRVTQVTTDDGSSQTQYLGRAVKTQDVNGVTRITQYDLLGRISGVCEISSSPLAGSTPTDCGMDISGSGYVTGYMYTLASHTTMVSQGNQSRTFVTDAAGRTISTTEPERGTTTYTYTNGGDTITRTRPKANQTNPSVTTNTVYGYDSLGRLAQVSYDDGTPTKYFYYDAVPSWLNWSGAASNLKGRLSSTLLSGSSYTTRSQYSYDVAGNVVAAWQCAPSICGTTYQESRHPMQFTYDLAGSLLSSNSVMTGVIAYGRSVTEQPTSVTNQTYSDTYEPSNLISNVSNGPFGSTHWLFGNSTSVVQSYDTQGRQNGAWLCSGNGADGQAQYCSGSSQMYGYLVNYGGSRVNSICDTIVNQCQAHGYDDFNRLTSVTSYGAFNSQFNAAGSFTYAYDRWGNRTSQTGSPSVTASFDSATNHSTGFGYDAAGNQTNDALHNYTYDADGNVLAVDGGSTAHYAYDALGQRVAGPGKELAYDPFGRVVEVWSLTGGVGSGYEGRIYWDGGLLAHRSSNGRAYFHHKDWLGTERLRTDAQGNVVTRTQSYAFGDGTSTTSTDANAAQSTAHFTGQEQDDESGTVHFQFRQYSSTQGRWMSPDPYSGSYDYSDPQSLNRYAYVGNDPYSFTDPLGLQRPRNTNDVDDVCNHDAMTGQCSGGGGLTRITNNGTGWGNGWNEFDALDAYFAASGHWEQKVTNPGAVAHGDGANYENVFVFTGPAYDFGAQNPSAGGTLVAQRLPPGMDGAAQAARAAARGRPTTTPTNSPTPRLTPPPNIGPSNVPPESGPGRWGYYLMQILRIIGNQENLTIPVFIPTSYPSEYKVGTEG